MSIAVFSQVQKAVSENEGWHIAGIFFKPKSKFVTFMMEAGLKH